MESRQPIKCPLCDASSPSKHHLAQHICRHLSYRKYECKTCAELFYTEEERDAHCTKRDHIHAFEVKTSQYCEHYVSILLKDAEYVAIHGVDAVIEQRTKASTACDEALKVLPGGMSDIEPSVRTSDEEGEKASCVCSLPEGTATIEPNRDVPLVPDQLTSRYSDRAAVNENQQITTESNDCKLNAASEELTDLSLNQPKDYFPWNWLLKELQVNVLRHLTRSDLDKCRLLNRETFQLIRRNEESMKRRIVEYLQIRIYESKKSRSFRLEIFVRCAEVGITRKRDLSVLNPGLWRTPNTFEDAVQHLVQSFSPWVFRSLSKLLKNGTIQHMEIGTGHLTNNIFWAITSCFLDVDCRVQKLSIGGASAADVTSPVFLEFLRNAAPTHIEFYGISDCSYDNFSPEVLEFIVTRPKFELRSLGPEPFPIDDDILAKLTASEFTIDAETRITVDGIKSFVGGLASGKHELIRGRIRIHISSGSLPFSTPSNIKVFYDGSILTLWHITPIKLQQ